MRLQGKTTSNSPYFCSAEHLLILSNESRNPKVVSKESKNYNSGFFSRVKNAPRPPSVRMKTEWVISLVTDIL